VIVDVFDRKRSSRCCVCLVAGILSFFPPFQIAASSERPNRKVIHECEWVDSRCVESLAMAVVLLIECFLCIYKKNREREGKVFLSFLAPPPPPPPPPPFFFPFFSVVWCRICFIFIFFLSEDDEEKTGEPCMSMCSFLFLPVLPSLRLNSSMII